METPDTTSAPLDVGPGAEAPQRDPTPGAIPLLYNEQTFNELVAANTGMAMQLSALQDAIELQAKLIGDREDQLADAQGSIDGYRATIKRLESDLNERDGDARFERDTAAAIQRKLDRTLGYLDRVIDTEEEYRKVEPHAGPAPAPDVGPDINSIQMPVRRRNDGSIHPGMAAFAENLRSHPAPFRTRRY